MNKKMEELQALLSQEERNLTEYGRERIKELKREFYFLLEGER